MVLRCVCFAIIGIIIILIAAVCCALFSLLHSLEFMRFNIIASLPFEYVIYIRVDVNDERARFKR